MVDDTIAKRIVTSTSVVFNLHESDLRGRGRTKNLAFARQVAMYLIYQETDCPLMAVGRVLGARTPATVSYGYQKVAKSLCYQPQLRATVAVIKKLVFEEI